MRTVAISCALALSSSLAAQAIEDLRSRGTAQVEDGDFDGAIASYSALLDRSSVDRDALSMRAWLHEKTGQPQLAIQDVNQLLELEIHPISRFDARFARGRIRCQLGWFEQARIDFNHILDSRPEFAQGLHWRGYASLRLHRYEEAARDLDRATRFGPRRARIWRDLGEALIALDDLDAAIQALQRATALAPSDPRAHHELGRALLQSGRTVAGRASLRRAAELDSTYGYSSSSKRVAHLAILAGVIAANSLALGIVGLILAPRMRRGRTLSRPLKAERVTYQGHSNELFWLWLRCLTLTLLTAGLYGYWARAAIRRYRVEHTVIHGTPLQDQTTARDTWLAFLQGITMLVVISAWAYFLADALTPLIGSRRGRLVAIAIAAAVATAIAPLRATRRTADEHARTTWRGLPQHFSARAGDYARAIRWEVLLTAITLGLYAPWLTSRHYTFRVRSTHMESVSFRSNLTGAQVLATIAPVAFLTIPTLGLSIPWLLHRWYNLAAAATSIETAASGKCSSDCKTLADPRAKDFSDGLDQS